MLEFYFYMPLILWCIAFISSVIDRYYPFILILLAFSHLLIGEASRTYNVYELAPLITFLSFGLAILSGALRKYVVMGLFAFNGLLYAWHLGNDLYVSVSGGKMLLMNFMYNGLHPDYVYDAIWSWLNVPSVVAFSILIYITVDNGIRIFKHRNTLPMDVVDNFQAIWNFIKAMANGFHKEAKSKNPQTLFKAYKKKGFPSKKNPGQT